MPSRPCSEPSWYSRDLSAQIEDLGRHAVHDPVDASGLGGHVSGRVACLPCHRGRLADVAVHRRQRDRDRFERRDGGRRRQRGGRCRRRGCRGRRGRRRRRRDADDAGPDESSSPPHAPAARTNATHAAAIRFRCAFMPRSCVPQRPRSCCRCRADLARTIPGAALQSDVPNWAYARRCCRSENLRRRDVRGYGCRIRDDGGRPRRRPADSATHATARSGPGGRHTNLRTCATSAGSMASARSRSSRCSCTTTTSSAGRARAGCRAGSTASRCSSSSAGTSSRRCCSTSARAPARIALKEFWFRRARRLLPALFLMLGVVVLFSLVFLRDNAISELKSDVDRGGDLHLELVADLRRPLVLRDGGPPGAAAAPLVAGDRGAVLPVLAAGPRASR